MQSKIYAIWSRGSGGVVGNKIVERVNFGFWLQEL